MFWKNIDGKSIDREMNEIQAEKLNLMDCVTIEIKLFHASTATAKTKLSIGRTEIIFLSMSFALCRNRREIAGK